MRGRSRRRSSQQPTETATSDVRTTSLRYGSALPDETIWQRGWWRRSVFAAGSGWAPNAPTRGGNSTVPPVPDKVTTQGGTIRHTHSRERGTAHCTPGEQLTCDRGVLTSNGAASRIAASGGVCTGVCARKRTWSSTASSSFASFNRDYVCGSASVSQDSGVLQAE